MPAHDEIQAPPTTNHWQNLPPETREAFRLLARIAQAAAAKRLQQKEADD